MGKKLREFGGAFRLGQRIVDRLPSCFGPGQGHRPKQLLFVEINSRFDPYRDTGQGAVKQCRVVPIALQVNDENSPHALLSLFAEAVESNCAIASEEVNQADLTVTNDDLNLYPPKVVTATPKPSPILDDPAFYRSSWLKR